MEVVVKMNPPEQDSYVISLSSEEMYVESMGKSLKINTKYEDRVNALISLFSCKNSWISEDNGYYQVTFILKDNKEEYEFKNVPDNWELFMAYITKLAGGII